MSESADAEVVEDAEIDGIREGSRFGGFLRGLLVGAVVSGAGLTGLSLVAPLPGHLPGAGPTVVVETPEQASEAEAAPAQDVDEQEGAPDTEPAKTATSQPEATAPEAETPSQPQARPETEIATAPEASSSPEGTQEPEAGPVTGSTEPDPATETRENGSEQPEASTDTVLPTRALSLDGPAFEINARRFEGPEGAPLLAIVLENAGNGAISAEALGLMTMPLTLAIRPDVKTARPLGEAARAFGHEVLAELPMSAEEPGVASKSTELTTAMPSGLLQSMTTSYLAELDMAIGATGPEGARLIADRAGMVALLAPVLSNGFAYFDLRTGLGSIAERVADDTGLIYAAGNRYVAAGATEQDVYQTLEGAAFQARRTGTAIVAISSSSAALKALVKWGLERGGQEVWFAPLSAVIKRRAEN